MPAQITFDTNIAEELTSWQNYAKDERKKRVFPSITISRHFGCEAHPLADELKRRLSERGDEKWVIVGKNLLDKIAEQSGVASPDIDNSGNLHFILQTITSIFREAHKSDHFDAFQYYQKMLMFFASTGNTILVGRGGVTLTQGLPNCINVRVTAPKEFRIKKIMRSHKMEEAAAKKFMEKQQRKRDEYIGRFTGVKSLNDPTLYNLVLNNAKNTPEEMAEIIEHYLIMKKWLV